MNLQQLLEQVAGQNEVVQALQKLQGFQLTEQDINAISGLIQGEQIDINAINSLVQSILSHEQDIPIVEEVHNGINHVAGVIAFLVAIALTVFCVKRLPEVLQKGEKPPTTIIDEVNEETSPWGDMFDDITGNKK